MVVRQQGPPQLRHVTIDSLAIRVWAPSASREREEVPITHRRRAGYPPEADHFRHLDTVTGEVRRGQIAPADRAHLRAWLARFAGRDDVAFALEGCTGWRYVAE